MWEGLAWVWQGQNQDWQCTCFHCLPTTHMNLQIASDLCNVTLVLCCSPFLAFRLCSKLSQRAQDSSPVWVSTWLTLGLSSEAELHLGQSILSSSGQHYSLMYLDEVNYGTALTAFQFCLCFSMIYNRYWKDEEGEFIVDEPPFSPLLNLRIIALGDWSSQAWDHRGPWRPELGLLLLHHSNT